MNTLSEEEKREWHALKALYQQKIMSSAASELNLMAIWQDSHDFNELKRQLSDLKQCLDAFRPLSAASILKLKEAFDIEYTYQSNKIEGNTLSKSETYLVICKGLTIRGKSLIEHLEAVNHQEAIDFIREMVSYGSEFNQNVLLSLHALILHGIDRDNAGRYRRENVLISGSDFVPPHFLKITECMDDYFSFYQQHQSTMHPVELAAEMHERLVTIHPFIDGNGRTARLVMNLMLLQHGYPLTILDSAPEKRLAYYDSLELTQTGKDPDKLQFKMYIAQNVKKWLFQYLNLLLANKHEHEKSFYFLKRIEALLIS